MTRKYITIDDLVNDKDVCPIEDNKSTFFYNHSLKKESECKTELSVSPGVAPKKMIQYYGAMAGSGMFFEMKLSDNNLKFGNKMLNKNNYDRFDYNKSCFNSFQINKK